MKKLLIGVVLAAGLTACSTSVPPLPPAPAPVVSVAPVAAPVTTTTRPSARTTVTAHPKPTTTTTHHVATTTAKPKPVKTSANKSTDDPWVSGQVAWCKSGGDLPAVQPKDC